MFQSGDDERLLNGNCVFYLIDVDERRSEFEMVLGLFFLLGRTASHRP
jgi:hypothetical protein